MKKAYDSEVGYISGETVVGGAYACERCGERLDVPKGKVTNLPVCPTCQGQSWSAA